MAKIKIKNKEREEKWNVLSEVFVDDFKGLTKQKDIIKLESIGFKYNRGKHPKIYFDFNSRTYCISVPSTSSAKCTGRDTLRLIRKVIDN